MHKKDLELLEEVKVFFNNKGSITIYGNYARFCIYSIKDVLEVIIPPFDKYPLRTSKQGDFILFRRAVKDIKKERHLIIEGLQDIVNIRATLN